MLPQIFRVDSPVFQLVLPPEHQQKLERLVADLPMVIFTASDSLGWVYQFWQAKKKDAVNASEMKIGAWELPAVTQLFTEPYMVSFLLDNSLGTWWATRRLTEDDLRTASCEEELRRKAAIPGVPLDYLRFLKKEDNIWQPASGTFADWPEHLSELKTLDPCCGSGHFLVAAFHMLVPMRIVHEELSAQEAVDAVLRENIHGLELDKRCVELAAFALALAAWTYPEAGGYRPLPELHIACSGLAISAKPEDWLALAGDNTNLRLALQELYKQFQNAPVLGSLINPETSFDKGSLYELTREEVGPLLGKALVDEKNDEIYDDIRERAIAAAGMVKAAELLAGKYTLIVTNVPYLARGKQTDALRGYCEAHYAAAKNDLATVFLQRCLELSTQGGTVSIVLPQNWLFLTTYKKFREKLLKNENWLLIARLGAQAFQTPMWDFNVQLLTLSRGNTTKASGGLFGEADGEHLIRGLDVSEARQAEEKAAALLTAEIKSVGQERQLENPDARVALEDSTENALLSISCDESSGCLTSDGERFYRFHWEQLIDENWKFLQSTVSGSTHYQGRNQVILWENAKGSLFALAEQMKGTNHAVQNWKRGQEVWGRKGIAISSMRHLPATFYDGFHFDNNTAVIVPHTPAHLPAIWCFCSSPEYNEAVRRIDQKLNVTNATLVKVPFDLDYWTQIAEERYPHGLPKPYSDDPTQWIFHGHPCASVIWDDSFKQTNNGPLRTDATVLQVALARLLGYRWPAELDEKMELADEQRAWVARCADFAVHVDDDGIVCIPPLRGEAAAADRLLNLLAAAYGDEWTNDTLAALLKAAEHEGKTLETWLRDKCFTQHCKLFQHRPFIWHIWDGLRDGFAALVNYHLLDHKTLETLIYTYLGDWISRQRREANDGIDGAQEKLAAAERLKKSLELILTGEAPYDIFVRWKPIEEQALGWHPDLNDGVRMNIRPFLSVPDVAKRGAGVLRDKPNIKWEKDRGKDVDSAPWYTLGLQYGGNEGDRINDHHLSLEEKRTAQETTNKESTR
jgi:hypothetical protein